jgi:dolichol-phosphate mannosyltransferase
VAGAPIAPLPLLSLVMPTFNEAANVGRVLGELVAELQRASIPFEILVVDDDSADATLAIEAGLAERWPQIRCLGRCRVGGFASCALTLLLCERALDRRPS